jgi:uncharacterized membrane protein
VHLRKSLRLFTFAEAHHRQVIAVIAAVLTVALSWHATVASRIIVGWDAYAVVLLGLAWLRIFTASPAVVVRIARLESINRTLLLMLVVLGACMSLGAVVFLLVSKKHEHGLPEHAILAAVTVGLSWLLVHTAFALHYADLYYRMPGTHRIQPKPQGLQFPGKGSPDFLDFAYFSFVIGMTSQVSDVQIASRGLRRWALLHGMISFGFNTAVLALSINVISGLF